MREIAEKVGYKKNTISRLLRNTKYEITNPSHSSNTKHTIKNRDFLHHQYVELGKSTQQIADEFGGSNNMVNRYLKKHEIPLRSQSESIALSHKNGYAQPLKGADNPRFGKDAKHGKGQWVNLDGEWHYMRSSWEIDVAKYLFLKGYNFKYEQVRFDLGDATYKPDFFIYKENGELDFIIEVKGWMHDGHARKSMLFQSLYPEIDYYIWDKEVYSLIKEEVA